MPISTNLDRVRLLIGDTDATDPLLSDNEVETCVAYRTYESDTLGTVVNLPAAAADAAAAIAAKFGREFNFAEDTQRFDRAQKVSHYLALEESLRRRSGGEAVSVGGTATTT